MRIAVAAIVTILLPLCAAAQPDSSLRAARHGLHGVIRIPYLNYLSLRPYADARERVTGFVGLGAGIRYPYRKDRFAEATVSVHMTNTIPIPVAVEKTYNKSVSSIGISVTDNLRCGRFELGYGLSYAANIVNEWTRIEWLPAGAPQRDTSFLNHGLGIALSSHYRFSERWSAGIVYRPTLLRVHAGAGYWPEHLVSVELRWEPGTPASRRRRYRAGNAVPWGSFRERGAIRSNNAASGVAPRTL